MGQTNLWPCNASHTMLWSIKKEKWFFGPKMPQEYGQIDSQELSQCIKDPVFSLHCQG